MWRELKSSGVVNLVSSKNECKCEGAKLEARIEGRVLVS